MMKRILQILILLVFSSGVSARTHSPFAVKTNLLYDALLNVNVGAELRLAPKWSLEISFDYNNWKLSNGKQWKHWLIQPEARYWLGDSFRKHFLATHLLGGEFNTTLGGYRRQGHAYGIGVGYGHTWRFGRHWGLEAEIAVGYARYHYDKYPCAQCGHKIATRDRNYIGPTKAAVNLVYYFGGKKKPVELPAPEENPFVDPMPEQEPVIEVQTAVDSFPEFDFPLVEIPDIDVVAENLVGVARVAFPVNKTGIDLSYGDNAREIESIVAKLDSVRNDLDMEVTSVTLVGYASPEGPYDNNEKLARNRTISLRDHLVSMRSITDSLVSVRFVAEDWEGLRNEIALSELSDRVQLLEIIDGTMSPDRKERALKRHAASWPVIAREMLPSLRRTEYKIEYEHRYKPDERDALHEVNRAIRDGNTDYAAMLLVDIPSSPEADYARGVVAATQHRYEEARAWFERAGSRGVNVASEAIHQLDIKTRHQ